MHMYNLIVLILYLRIDDTGEAKHPYLTHPDCPLKPGLASQRQCPKKRCLTDSDCINKNKRCLCDGSCSKRCVKPNKKCEDLVAPTHGVVDVLPFNTFGAKARYKCGDGYMLAGGGVAERVCQGDGKWSGQAPSCQSEGSCRDPPQVPHAFHDGAPGQKTFPLGTQLTYQCVSGFTIFGFFRAMCVGEGHWVGARMNCSPKRCEHPEDVPHARREGNVFEYPNRVVYHCMEGYELRGRPYRVCGADGLWSGYPPICMPVQCPRLTPPQHGYVQVADVVYGSVAHFSCERGYSLSGSRERQCQGDGSWSGGVVTCSVVDCGLPDNFWNGFIDGSGTTYDSVINYKCHGTATFDGTSYIAVCQHDGNWSIPVPTCWGKCRVPEIPHGQIPGQQTGDYIKHGYTINLTCFHGYHVSDDTKKIECSNGTWLNLPQCIPAPCKNRPPQLQDGMVRYHAMNHGDHALYNCHTGFLLKGGHTITCINGEWQGKLPACEPVHCYYPGPLENGVILLVGVVGKFEYRSYASDIGHNEQIEFHCNKGYKRQGPEAATCVDGVWSPAVTTTCETSKHPQLTYMYRG